MKLILVSATRRNRTIFSAVFKEIHFFVHREKKRTFYSVRDVNVLK